MSDNDRYNLFEPRLDLNPPINRPISPQSTGEQAYDDLAIHHPKTNREAVRRNDPNLVDSEAAVIDGELEAIRSGGDRNGIPLVKKDIIYENQNGDPNVMIPNPVAGYAYFNNNEWNSVSIYDRPRDQPGAELVGQVLHGARNSSQYQSGDFVPYGAPLIRQSDAGSPGAIHGHIELEPAQYKQYLGDMLNGTITQGRYPPPQVNQPGGEGNALYEQAKKQLDELPKGTFKNDQERDNAAAALAASAYATKGTPGEVRQIADVTMNEQGMLFALDRVGNTDVAKRVEMPLQQAVSQTIQQSTEQVQQRKQELQAPQNTPPLAPEQTNPTQTNPAVSPMRL
jgi:hypothetical protein